MQFRKFPVSVLGEIYVLWNFFSYGLTSDFWSGLLGYIIYSLLELVLVTAQYTKLSGGSYLHLTVNNKEFETVPRSLILFIFFFNILPAALFLTLFLPGGIAESFAALPDKVVQDMIFFTTLAIIFALPRAFKDFRKNKCLIELEKRIIDLRTAPILFFVIVFITGISFELVSKMNINYSELFRPFLVIIFPSLIVYDLYVWYGQKDLEKLRKTLVTIENRLLKLSFLPWLFLALIVFAYFLITI